jgi:hypothetical protein
MKVSGKLHISAASLCGKYLGTHWRGGCAGSKAAMDVVKKIKTYTSCQSPNSRVHQPVRFTLHYDLSPPRKEEEATFMWALLARFNID